MSTLRNILVIVDPTASEHPAVNKAAFLAEKFGARVELYACETKASRAMRLAEHARAGAKSPFVSNMKAVLESIAAPLRARHIDVTTESVSSDPLHLALADRAKRTSADLVVKDTHHHSLAKRTFLTNTDWELIRACPVSLLLAKPGSWSQEPRVFAAIDPGHVSS